jgi:hypothetical protein
LELNQSISSLTRALLEVLRVRRRAGLLGEIAQDRRALGEAEIAVLENRDQTVGILLAVDVAIMLALGREVVETGCM